MNFIKTSLCLEGAVNYFCLKIFPAVARSEVFHQFIQKRIVGKKSQPLSQQQYKQITAQLQYDDTVLNQLMAVFVFITLFMDCDQSLNKLMTQVIQLDTSHELKQLETVTENISLVQLWFSRAVVGHSFLFSSSYLPFFSLDPEHTGAFPQH